MKKRQRKKNLKSLLTKEEMIVLELYRKGSSVKFYLHDCEFYEAHDFASAVVKEPIMQHHRGGTWLKGELDKIKAVAFLKEEAE